MSLGNFTCIEDSVTQSFQEYNEILTQESLVKEEIRTAVRDLEDHARNLTNLIQAVHHPQGILKVSEISNRCSTLLNETSHKIRNLATKFDSNSYYKYHDQWRFTIQRLVFVALFVEFMKTYVGVDDDDEKKKEDGAQAAVTTQMTATTTATAAATLTASVDTAAADDDDKIFFLSHQECASILGLKVQMEEGFPLELEDYLIGLLMLSSELARLSTNAVTCGDFKLPLRIGRFVGKLDQAFRLLNLKNDHLRKRYDALKYDLKRVEVVAYDLSIRGLK